LSEIAPLPSDRTVQSLNDILESIVAIEGWVRDVGGIDSAVDGSRLFRSAVERELLIVSEAAIRIDREDSAFGSKYAPEIDWPGIRGIGNIIRHRYDDMDRIVTKRVLGGELERLAQACRRVLGQRP
jgi:uncharacterized protein with HEPN domain